MLVTPYLNFDGQCAEAFRFYAECLGGKITFMQTHGESPLAKQIPPDWHDRILHAVLVANGVTLLASDSPPGMHERPQGIWVSLQVEEVGHAERVFRTLSEGGKVTMPLEKTFWAERFGMFFDRYGIPWMINCGGTAADD